MNTRVDYYKDQAFLDVSENSIWHLIDVIEQKSLIKKSKVKTFVHLINLEENQMRKIFFADFDSNYRPIKSKLFEQVLTLNDLLTK